MPSFTARRKWFFFAFMLLGLGLLLARALPVYAQDAQPRPVANPDPDCAVQRFEDDPDPVPRSGTTDFWVLVRNYTADPASGVDLVIRDLGHVFGHVGVSFDPAAPPGASCSYNSSAFQLECNFPNFPGNAYFWVIWTVRADGAPGQYNSEAEISCSPDASTVNNLEGNKTDIIRGVDLEVSKGVASTTVEAGSIVTFDITVTNHGPDDSSTGIVLTDTLDPDLVFVADDANPPADDDAAWDCTAAGSDITCTFGGTLAVGASTTFHYRARVAAVAPATVGNDASVTVGDPDVERDPDETNNTSSVSLTVEPGTDVSIEKQILSGTPLVGGTLASFRLVVSNLGPMDTADLTVVDNFPAGYTIDPADITVPAGWNCTVSGSGGPNPTVTCQLSSGTLTSGSSVNIDIDATPPEPSAVENHTNQSSVTVNDLPDPVPDNNSSSVSYDVYPNKPDLAVVKSVSPKPVAQGSPITITLTVTNNGAVDANPVVLRDDLDAGESVDPATLPSGTPWDCSYDSVNHDVVCTYTDSGGTLAAGASASVSYQVTAANSGTLQDTACAEVNQAGRPDDYDSTNDCDSDSTKSTSEHADLVVQKTVDDTHLTTSEDTLTFTITITNNGPNNSGAVSFDDDVPFYVPAGPGGRSATSISATATGGGSCSVTGGTVSCSWSDIPAGDTVTVTYTVTRPMRDGASIVNDVCAYSSDIGDPDRSNNCDAAPAVQVDPVTDVEVVSKTVADNPTTAGTETTYTMQVRNNGPSVATNVVLTDTFSATPSTATFTYINANATHGGSCTWSAPTLTCTWASLDPGTTATVTLDIRPDHIEPPPSPWQFTNNASVTTDTAESNTSNNGPVSVTMDVTAAQLDVVLEKNESPGFLEPVRFDPATPSANKLVYELVLYNRGPSVATQIHIDDRVEWVDPVQSPNQQLEFLYDTENPDGTDDAVDWCTPPSPNPFSVNGVIDNAEPLISCDAPAGFVLEPGQMVKRYLVFQVHNAPDPISGDVYYNTATLTVYETPQETYTGNNTEDERTTVRTVVDLQVSKTAPASPVEIYTPFTMTITVHNAGPGVAVSTELSDTLPAGMELTAAPSPSSGSCTGAAGDTAFTCTLGDLNAGDTVTVDVEVQVTDAGTTSYVNTATVDSAAPDTDTTNNTASATVTMNPPVRLGDRVWYDQNQNGVQDTGEPGLQGVDVTIYASPDCAPGTEYSNASMASTTTTDSNGNYSFYPLPHGTYCVEFSNVPLSGYLVSPQNNDPDDTIDSDADTGTQRIENIDLTNTALTEDLTQDMGVFVEGSIGDRVWCESPQNVNDTFDTADGDYGMNAITVSLYEDFDCDNNPDGAAIATLDTTTGGIPNEPGFYQFSGLQVALAGSSNQTCYVVQVDTNDPDLGHCFLPDTPADGTRYVTLDTNFPDDDTADFSFRLGDFGDLPDTGSGAFPTTLADNGPYHLLDEDLYLGVCVDSEDDGAPDDEDAGMVTGGDDGILGGTIVGTSCADDEDGIEFVTPFIPGQQACVAVTAHNATGNDINLYGWADWNGDGQFDTAERLSGGDFSGGGASIPNGGVTAQEYCFDVPAGATFANGDIHFRFRLTTESLSAGAFDGPASNGEVEDYWLPLACVGNYLWDDGGSGANDQQDAGDSGLANVPVRLVWGGTDGTVDTLPDASSPASGELFWNTTTDANGRYQFCGIAPPSAASASYTFQVQVPPYLGLRSVTNDAAGDQIDSDGTPANSLASGWAAPSFTVAPRFLGGAPAYMTLNGGDFPTSEAGNEDAASQSSAGYIDERTDWTQDFGFLVFKDYGDLPNSGAGSFNTTQADGGPWHWVTPDLYLGTCVDVESDGQPDDPDAGALGGGDDGNAGFATVGTCASPGADEDGVTLVSPLIAGQQACVQVTAHNETGGTAYLYAWFDWNGDGQFDAGEQVNTGDFSGGSYAFGTDITDQVLCFDVPATATFDGGEVHMRFRLTTDSGLTSPDGGAPDGEVEDYWAPLSCVGSYVWADADLGGDQDAGEAPFVGLPLRLVAGGSNGTVETAATDASPAGDDYLYTTTTDGDGNYVFCGLVPGMSYQVQIPADDSLYSVTANTVGDDQDSDATPELTRSGPWTAPTFSLTLDGTQPGYVAKDGGAMPTGEAGIGDSTLEANDNNTPDERTDWTQDFGFVLYYDYGDAPDSFGTTAAANGPSHLVSPNLYLGSCVDVETDGQPGPQAGVGGTTGDDTSVGFATEGTCAVAGNDEDGLLSAITPAPPGGTACFQVAAYNNTGSDARLYVWIDWDGDDAFQADERLTGVDFSAGYATIPDGTTPGSPLTLCFTMPSAADMVFDGGEVHSRLRLTTEDLDARGGGYEAWEGPAVDGEVEDYWSPLACVGNYLWIDNGSTPNAQDGTDTPFPNVEVRLVWAGPTGGIETAPSDTSAGGDDVILATTTTDANGRYMFCGVAPGPMGTGFDYQVQVLPVPGYMTTAKDAAADDLDSDASPAGGLATGWAADEFNLAVDYTAAPGYIVKDGGAMPTGEGGNEDANSEAADANFPDQRTDWTQDFGFIKYDDYGDLPASFEGGNPAVHPLRLDLYLGSCVDAETINAPDAEAGMDGVGGDDATAGDYTVGTCATPNDDEDGVRLTTPLVPGAEACVEVTAHNATGGNAYLTAWFDWNGNGQFDAGEQVNTGDFSGGQITIPDGGVSGQQYCFTVPTTATFDGGEVHYRFRLTTDAALSAPNGPAADGEVEDYWAQLACVGNLVWNDSTGISQDVQDASDSGVSGHEVRLVWAGSDGIIQTLPSHATAQNDDRLYTTTTDANGVYTFCGLTQGGTYQVQLASAPSGLPQAVAADAGADDVDSDASALGGGFVAPSFTLSDVTALPTGEGGNQDNGATPPNNFPDSQVDETIDFGFRPIPVDYGDLPDSYGTTASAGGASHVIDPDLYLGCSADAELDGQPSTDATGDDSNNGYFAVSTCLTTGSDENGVRLTTPLVPGSRACVEVTAHNATGGNAFLYAWFDWNGNGQFDAGEQVDALDFSGGMVTITGDITDRRYCFTVPTTATFNGGQAAMRFRLTTDLGIGATGAAADGEVEDYIVPLYCAGNFVWNDGGSATPDIQDGTEPGIAGVTLTLHWDGDDNGSFGDPADRTYTTTTDANGFYTFCGLLSDATGDTNPDSYRIDVTPPTGLTPVAADQGGDEALDSDGDASGVGPVFTLPPSPDSDTAGNDTDPNGYPDAQTQLAIDFGFAAYDFGDLPAPYATTLADGGPRHTILPSGNPTLGSAVDPETDGQPDAAALGDDNTNTDDEDGLSLPAVLQAGHTYTVGCTVTNDTAATRVSVWFDWNGDGDFADPGEEVVSNATPSGGDCSFTVTVPFSVASSVAVRARVANETIPGPNGALGSGEVEDYLVAGQLTYDYGDLPDSFGTLDASGGPKHQLDPGLYLGACLDGDDDAFVDPDAGMLDDGDDAADAADTADIEIGTCTAGDDEDGVTLTRPLVPGTKACVEVTAVNTLGVPANLYGWIDFNGNGQFDSGEQLASRDFAGGFATISASGTAEYCFDVPTTATFDGGGAYMRFRLTTDALTGPGGEAGDGEVEDYWYPLACAGNYVWNDTGSTVINEQDPSDQALENVTVELILPGDDGTLGTADDVVVTTTTDANGRYAFCGLTPDTQAELRISTLPAGLNQPVVPDQGSDVSDSDATQPGGLGSPVIITGITVPNFTDLAAGNWVTGENANEDNSTQSDPALTHGYPDGRTNLTFDFGLRQVTSAAVKSVVATDQTFTAGSDVAIGEIVTYETTLTLSPGTVDNLTLTDVLEQGLAFVACDSITATGSITASAGAWDAICSAATVSAEPPGDTTPVNQGRRVTWSFGSVTNSGLTDATITVRYTVVVLDSADNVRGQTLRNAVIWTWDAGSADAQADPVTVVEPDLIITKEADPQIAGPGESITFTLTVTHSGTSDADAFDVVLTDDLPAGLEMVPGTLTAISGLTPTSLTYDTLTRTITATWDSFPQGATAVIEFKADLTVPDGVVVTNEAFLAWSSLPGDLGDDYALSPHNALARERNYDPPASGYVSRDSVEVYWKLPDTGFAPGRVTPLPAMPQGFAYEDLGDLWLEIPRLGIKLPIIGVPRTAEGWNLTWLGRDVAGHLEGTVFPTWEGNSVITAHVFQADGLPGPFYGLDRLQWGDRILIHFQGQVYVYEVREAFRTDAYSYKPMQAPVEGYPWVTLFTCQGYDEDLGGYRWRVVVQAVLVEVYGE